MADATTPLQRLTFQLTTQGITDPDRILKDRSSYAWREVRTSAGLVGLLFARRSIIRTPEWLDYVLPYIEGSAEDLGLAQASSAAVLLIQRADRLFVLVFGTGRSMLMDGVFDERFGLRTTLNAVAPNELRSIDRKTFSEVQRHTREDISRAAGLEAFGINVEEDLLRGVTGRPGDKTLGGTMAGLGATLAVSTRTTLEGLPSLLDRYAQLNKSTAYKTNFAWVDNIKEVKDSLRAEDLFEKLVTRIRRGETDRVWLAPPDLLSWTAIRGFAYSSAKSAEEYDDLRIEDYLGDRGRGASLAVSHLRSDYVICLPVEGGEQVPSWSVKNCLCADMDVDDKRYILSDGKWYEIEDNYAKRVIAAVARLNPTATRLPSFKHADEDKYNLAAEKASKGELIQLHRKLVDSGTGRGRIEVCDLYSKNRRFIHVKRYGGSSVLSHLFAQGVVSGEMFFTDRTFRRSVDARLPPTHKIADPNAQLARGDYEVAYAIIGPRGRDLILPFFSALNLKNAARLLDSWGFTVTLTSINNLSRPR